MTGFRLMGAGTHPVQLAYDPRKEFEEQNLVEISTVGEQNLRLRCLPIPSLPVLPASFHALCRSFPA
jgi:hypothetical protein